MHSVIVAGKQLHWEAGHATLTSVECVPNMVHHGIDSVIKSCFFVYEEDWLHSSVPSIVIQALKLQKTDVSSLADISLLSWLVNTIRIGSSHSLVIGNQHEIFWG